MNAHAETLAILSEAITFGAKQTAYFVLERLGDACAHVIDYNRYMQELELWDKWSQ